MSDNTLGKAFSMGRYSFYNGVFDCPYKNGSMMEKEWNRGFNTAYFDNLKKVKAREASR